MNTTHMKMKCKTTMVASTRLCADMCTDHHTVCHCVLCVSLKCMCDCLIPINLHEKNSQTTSMQLKQVFLFQSSCRFLSLSLAYHISYFKSFLCAISHILLVSESIHCSSQTIVQCNRILPPGDNKQLITVGKDGKVLSYYPHLEMENVSQNLCWCITKQQRQSAL